MPRLRSVHSMHMSAIAQPDKLPGFYTQTALTFLIPFVKGDTRNWEYYITRNFVVYTDHFILSRWLQWAVFAARMGGTEYGGKLIWKQPHGRQEETKEQHWNVSLKNRLFGCDVHWAVSGSYPATGFHTDCVDTSDISFVSVLKFSFYHNFQYKTEDHQLLI